MVDQFLIVSTQALLYIALRQCSNRLLGLTYPIKGHFEASIIKTRFQ